MKERTEVVESSPMQSKKFVAYLVAELTWKILAGLVLFWGKDSIPQSVFVVLLAIILVAGFVETGYILGQVSIDKFIQLAAIVKDKNPTEGEKK
jgi:hypothetical protein